jgi:hypothetical protein
MTDGSSEATGFEREKWLAEHQLKERELGLKARELEIRVSESNRARWTNPLALAIAGAALAAGGNVVATYYTGVQQRSTESLKHRAEQERERERSEAQLILEVIKTANPDKAAENLNFLVKTSLINDDARRAAITTYVASRPSGTGVSLPVPSTFSIPRGPDTNHIACRIENYQDVKAIADALETAHRHPRWRSKTGWTSTESGMTGDSTIYFNEYTTFFVTHDVSKVSSDVVVRTTLEMSPVTTQPSRRTPTDKFFAEMYDDFRRMVMNRYYENFPQSIRRAMKCVVPDNASAKEVAEIEGWYQRETR